jgi:hypothetical protein
VGRLSCIGRGVDAGALGTVAMDAFLYRRYHHAGGESSFLSWESSEGMDTWDKAAAPARVAKRLLERALKRDIAPRYARLLNNATHWGFGLVCGGGYGVLVHSRSPRWWYGVPFGAAVWTTGYVVLPQLGVYEQIWKYDLPTLAKDLSAHLVYGTATAIAFSL